MLQTAIDTEGMINGAGHGPTQRFINLGQPTDIRSTKVRKDLVENVVEDDGIAEDGLGDNRLREGDHGYDNVRWGWRDK